MEADLGRGAGSAGLSLCLFCIPRAVLPECLPASNIRGGYLKGSIFALAAPRDLGSQGAQEIPKSVLPQFPYQYCGNWRGEHHPPLTM